MLHRGLPAADRVEAEELDGQVRPRGARPAPHEPVPHIRLQEQNIPGTQFNREIFLFEIMFKLAKILEGLSHNERFMLQMCQGMRARA